MSGFRSRLMRLEREIARDIDAPVTVLMIGRAALGEIDLTPRQVAFVHELLAEGNGGRPVSDDDPTGTAT